MSKKRKRRRAGAAGSSSGAESGRPAVEPASAHPDAPSPSELDDAVPPPIVRADADSILVAAFKAGDWDCCLQWAEAHADLTPHEYRLVALAHLARDERPAAVAAAEVAVERDPCWQSWGTLREILTLKQSWYDQPTDVRDRVRELALLELTAPDAPEQLLVNAAWQLIDVAACWTEQVLTGLESALERFPSNLWLRLNAAQVARIARQDLPAARAHLERLTWAPDVPVAERFWVSHEWNVLGDAAQAIAWSEGFKAPADQPIGFRMYRATLLWQLGRFDEARAIADELCAFSDHRGPEYAALIYAAIGVRTMWNSEAQAAAEQVAEANFRRSLSYPRVSVIGDAPDERVEGNPLNLDLEQALQEALARGRERYPVSTQAWSRWAYMYGSECGLEDGDAIIKAAWDAWPDPRYALTIAEQAGWADRVPEALTYLVYSLERQQESRTRDEVAIVRAALASSLPGQLEVAATTLNDLAADASPARLAALRAVYEQLILPARPNGDGSRFAPLLRALVQAYPQEAFLWGQLGFDLHSRREAEQEVVAAYERACALGNLDWAWYNLALIRQRMDDEDGAVNAAATAAQLRPTDQKYQQHLTGIRAWAESRRRQRQEREDFLASARARWAGLNRYQTKLLAVLKTIRRFRSMEHLAELAGMEVIWVERHYQKLVDQGMVIEEGDSYHINPHIEDLIAREQTHAVATQIIRADPNIAFKPVFNSRREYDLYAQVLALFPNMLVFPNMALQGIFQYARVKELLDRATFEYYLKASVDLCIVSSATYFPVIALELDSKFHDQPTQQARDLKKDLIFRLGGVPLLRLRPHGEPTPERLRVATIEAVHALGHDLRATHQGIYTTAAEINFDRFSQLAGPAPAPSDA